MRTKAKLKPHPKKIQDVLPKKFQGADVLRGLAMNADDLDDLIEKKSFNQFIATRDMWLVIENNALEDPEDTVEVKAFATKEIAVRYAQAHSNGNIDHRVLRVPAKAQTLVVGTDNEPCLSGCHPGYVSE